MTGADVLLAARRQDWRRHVHDLQTNSYEGALARPDREAVFRQAFALTTPVALSVLERLAASYIGADAVSSTTEPRRVPAGELEGADREPMGGLLGSWNLTWPALERSRNRLSGESLPPVQLFAIYPDDFTHPHLALFDISTPRTWIACWPFQVTSGADAARQEPTLAAIAEADLHERTFAGDLNWRVLEIVADA